MTVSFDEAARTAELRAELRAHQRRENELVRRLGSAVVIREDAAPIHAQLRDVRERAEECVAGLLLLDI